MDLDYLLSKIMKNGDILKCKEIQICMGSFQPGRIILFITIIRKKS